MKRQAFTCNRCTVDYFHYAAQQSLYCDECNADFTSDMGHIQADNASNNDKNESKSGCLVCDIDFTDIPLQEQEAHLLICLDKWVEKFSGTNNSWSQEISENNDKKIEPELGIRSAIFYCVICDVDISKKGLLNRSLHLKKCAKDNKIAT